MMFSMGSFPTGCPNCPNLSVLQNCSKHTFTLILMHLMSPYYRLWIWGFQSYKCPYVFIYLFIGFALHFEDKNSKCIPHWSGPYNLPALHSPVLQLQTDLVCLYTLPHLACTLNFNKYWLGYCVLKDPKMNGHSHSELKKAFLLHSETGAGVLTLIYSLNPIKWCCFHLHFWSLTTGEFEHFLFILH